METYKYTISDGHGFGSDWEDYSDVEIEAEDDDEAIEQAVSALEVAVAGLGSPDYEAGDKIYVSLDGPDGIRVFDTSREVEDDSVEDEPKEYKGEFDLIKCKKCGAWVHYGSTCLMCGTDDSND